MKTVERTFNTIEEMLSFITHTPTNKIFSVKHKLSSQRIADKTLWEGTYTYEDAIYKLKHGDEVAAKKLEGILKTTLKAVSPKTQRIPEYNVMGYQASVPRYLQGIPTNMINHKNVVKKQKVMTLTKSIGFNCGVTAKQLFDESLKAFEVIAKIEAQGTRCNLDLVWVTVAEKEAFVLKVRIKHSQERIQIAKLAFCLTNPAMLRRIGFKALEVETGITDPVFEYAYGNSQTKLETLTKFVKDAGHLIPSYIDSVDKLVEQFTK